MSLNNSTNYDFPMWAAYPRQPPASVGSITFVQNALSMKSLLIPAAAILSYALLSVGCIKQANSENNKTVKGSIYSKNDSLPISNQTFELRQIIYTGFNNTDRRTVMITTDANGSFSAVFNVQPDGRFIDLSYPASVEIATSSFDSSSQIDFGRVYTQRK